MNTDRTTGQPNRPARSSHRDHDRDRGAALVVAIGFTVAIGAMAAGLATMVTSGIGNRIALEQIRDRQYAADGAVEDAVASTRTAIGAGTLACGAGTSLTSSLNDVGIRVDVTLTCAAVPGTDGLPVIQPVARFDACVDEGHACAADAVVVRALVGFGLDGSGAVVGTSVRSWSVLR